jgi:predicted lipoprotein
MASVLRNDLLVSLVDTALETAIASVATSYRAQWTADDGTQSDPMNLSADLQSFLQNRKEIMGMMVKRLIRKSNRNKVYGLVDAGKI